MDWMILSLRGAESHKISISLRLPIAVLRKCWKADIGMSWKGVILLMLYLILCPF